MSGPEIVGRQHIIITKPPEHVPSGTVVDGAVLGNGDVGVVIGGPPDDLRFYIGKNDFWSQQASPMTVGGIELSVAGLKGASYREEEDLLHAEAWHLLDREDDRDNEILGGSNRKSICDGT